jgi:hypothetical protein
MFKLTKPLPYCNHGRDVQSPDSHAVLQLPTIRPCLGSEQATSPFSVVWGQSHAHGMPGKGQYSINTNMLQLQVGGQRGTSSPQESRLQAHRGRDMKKKVAESAQNYNRKGVLFQPHHSRTIFRCDATQQHTATAAASVTLSCTGLPQHSGRNECLPLWGTTKKYQFSQFRLLVQTVHL